MDFAFQTGAGEDEVMTMQIAEDNKALGSISYLVDRGYRVTFDKDPKTGQHLSMIIKKKTNNASRFRRDRNVWVLDAFVASNTPMAPSANEQAGFIRRG